MASETQPPALERPQQSNFTIGWICILQKEYRAALAVLDEKYDTVTLARGEGDQNRYTLGRIGDHYVVINMPPSGWNGGIRASLIASSMRSTFPRLRFVLNVGIAGGAPSPKEDVRLGDVVLGTQVIPWNTGRWTQNGFERTGLTMTPPRELCEAITFFDQRFWSPDRLILSESIEDIAKKPCNGTAFLRPIKDRLYKTGFPHPETACDCLQTQSKILHQLSPRGDRDGETIRVFKGAIGSDDVVMKNASVRDEVTKREKILCFEMESKGLMDIMPCLPIRGISDYSDEHKNDDWHLYAALAAATCARELLLSLSPYDVARFPLQITGDIVERYMKGAVSSPNVFVGSETEKLRQARDILIQRRDFLRELVMPDIRQKQRIYRNDSPELRDDMQRLKDSQDILKRHLQDLSDIIDDHEELGSSPDPAVQEDYRDLKRQVQKDLQAIESLTHIAGGTLKNTGDMLVHLAEVCQNQGMNVAGMVMIAVSSLLGKTTKLWRSCELSPVGICNWVSKKMKILTGRRGVVRLPG